MVNLSLPVLSAGRKGHGHRAAVKTRGGLRIVLSDPIWNSLGPWSLGEKGTLAISCPLPGLSIELGVGQDEGNLTAVTIVKDPVH